MKEWIKEDLKVLVLMIGLFIATIYAIAFGLFAWMWWTWTD